MPGAMFLFCSLFGVWPLALEPAPIWVEPYQVFPGGIMLPAKSGDVRDAGLIPGLGRSLGWEDPLEEGIATHSSIFAWRILWTEEPGGLQSIGSQRVRHD